MKKNKNLFLYTLIALPAAIVIYFLYPLYHPNSSINPELNVNGIKKITETLLTDQKISMDKSAINVYTAKNQTLIKDVQRKYGLKKANVLLSKIFPAYFFEVNLVKENEITLSSDSNKKDKKGADDRSSEENLVNFDFRGKVINLNRVLVDSLESANIEQPEAKQLVEEFARKYSGIYDKIKNASSKDSTINKFNDSNKNGAQLVRVIHKFSWEVKDSAVSAIIKVNATVTGSIITKFSVDYSITGLITQKDENTVVSIVEAIVYLIIIIVIAVTGYKKIRAFEIGYKNALLMGVVSGISFAVFIVMQAGSEIKGEIWIPVVATFIFWGGFVFVIWAVAEAVVRELWKEKFHTFDVIMKGDILNSKVGENIIIGGCFGIVMLAIYLILISFLDKFINIQAAPGDEVLRMYANKFVFLYFFNFNLHFVVFYFMVFIAFIFTSLNKKYLKTLSASALTILLWGLSHKSDISPFYYSVLVQIFIGTVILYIFNKYEVFTAIFAMSTFAFLVNFLPLFFVQNTTFNNLQILPVLAIGGILIFAITSLSTKDLITDINSILPVYAEHITERQRLQRELEIAREVQMSFLPRKNPEFKGLDIAAMCVPAMEVGGDYYDFIEFDNDRFGIVVGDVSGKGTQAAFYMTLSKGFLKAIAKTSSSPKEVLIKMNNMFYENVDRGTFITMVIGIFDIRKKELTISSAGHNPTLVKDASNKTTKYVVSKGLALGLEKGEIFGKTIDEIKLPFFKDDTFVFFTDGFNEAMNKKREEFGDEKMLDTLSAAQVLSSGDILENYFKVVNEHIGKAVQHDDMSMVVVRIK